MASAAESTLDIPLTKRLLGNATKEEPVHCAIGLASDGKTGLLLLHKTKEGNALKREMLATKPKPTTARSGVAFSDEGQPGLVKLLLEGAAPGMAKRLVKTLKGTGFKKVEICDADGASLEAAGDDKEGAATDDGEAAATETAAAAEDAPAPASNADAVRDRIRALVPKVQAAPGDPVARGQLVAGLQRANTLLKAGAIEEALAAVEQTEALLAAPPPAASAGPALSPVKLGKASLVWRRMWAGADKDLQDLQSAVIGAMMTDDDVDPDDYAEIEGNLRSVMGITTRLNMSLADDLDALRNATADTAAGPLRALERRLDEYETFLNTDEWVVLLADNEFHPVPVQANLLRAVKAIRDALHPE